MVRVIGAGLGRTGTASLKLALETLLGGPCYHMFELLQRRDDAATWAAALSGEPVDWPTFLDGWTAVVDFPACAAVDELAAAFPDAKVLLSTRDPESWWDSADRTILQFERRRVDGSASGDMGAAMLGRVGIDPHDRDVSIAAFVAHERRIRETFGPERLIEWRSGDGWEPLCDGLGLAEPDEPFPHSNSSASFFDEVEAALRGEVRRNAEPPLAYRRTD
ncbi:MAG: sulfotransferase family protein [Ilumatobacter sp.]|jgi:hypothetical protein|uniref:sulfotransferase family protein n=1 Tax=Ilumatobacter sp. TaxID=1967498 RepID=UPI003918EA1C